MSSAIQNSSYTSTQNNSHNRSCCDSKWFAIALIICSIVLFGGAAIFGGMGMFMAPSQMPYWMLQGVGTIGFGCLGLFVGGSYLAAFGVLVGAALLVKAHTKKTQTDL